MKSEEAWPISAGHYRVGVASDSDLPLPPFSKLHKVPGIRCPPSSPGGTQPPCSPTSEMSSTIRTDFVINLQNIIISNPLSRYS